MKYRNQDTIKIVQKLLPLIQEGVSVDCYICDGISYLEFEDTNYRHRSLTISANGGDDLGGWLEIERT